MSTPVVCKPQVGLCIKFQLQPPFLLNAFSPLCLAMSYNANTKSSILRLIVDIPYLTSRKVQDGNTKENIAKNVTPQLANKTK